MIENKKISEATPLATSGDWEFAGHRSGPRLAVFGSKELARKAVAALSRVPSLGYMRGSISIRVLPDGISSVRVPFDADEIVILDKPEFVGRVGHVHWQILGRAAALGMVRGRGIPCSWLKA